MLAACLPTLAIAQQPLAPHREGSWEFSLGGGFMLLDASLRDFLGSGTATTRFANDTSPSRFIPTAVVRVGYNFTRNLGFSVSGGGAIGSGVTYLTPTAAITYTLNLNAKTSPFILVGTQFTRISGNNGRVTHSTWGAHAGLGVRSMVSERLALRLEGRMEFEGYNEAPWWRNTVYNPVVTLGISYFAGGRRPPAPAMAPAPCPVCPRALTRVDTVRVYVPFPTPPPPVIVLRDTLVLEGVNFAFDESALTPESHEILDRVARALLEPQWVNVRFEVAGHTSSVATAEYNMALSERRAEAVRAYLVSRGVANSRMTARGYGETQPIFPDNSEGDAWQNRRVELRRIR
jgi:outer membrane protein OmpA-like peptidoglycan-associated protein